MEFVCLEHAGQAGQYLTTSERGGAASSCGRPMAGTLAIADRKIASKRCWLDSHPHAGQDLPVSRGLSLSCGLAEALLGF